MRFILTLFIAMAAVILPSLSFAQDPKDDVIRIDTQLVDVPIAVTTPAGVAIRGLKKSNFVVYEDGKKQEIADFSATADPFEVALLLDTSGSTRNDLALIKRSAQYFIDSLRPGDRVAIISFNTARDAKSAFAVPEVLSELTSDRRTLTGALSRAATSNGTPLYDALLQVVNKVFRDPPGEQFRGRRALVGLTDGVDSSSVEEFDATKEELEQRGLISFFIRVDTRDDFEAQLLGDCQSAVHFSAAQIRRYYRSIGGKGNERAVNFCGLGDFERLAVSKRLYEIADIQMDDLAKTSGGKVFPVGDLTEARAAFKGVADEIGTKYTIGYYPSNEKRDGSYRQIKVDVVGQPKGTVVRARDGYTAPTH
ncbi:MAG TPA: VWA domain-containing protein [Pyrinomonadaceae bacterium]|jgi:VWFA-related protein|nr:VWA domain-containing protein [Pyrinomonadaceae bacterium]